MKKIKEHKKEKKKWSRKKKLILYPIISFFVIIALLSACTAAGFMAVEHDVKDANRKARYIQIFTEIMEKKAGTDLAKPKASDFDEFREMEDERAEQSGYIVKMKGNVYDKAGNYYEARTEFWAPKNLKRYQVDLAKCQKKGKSEKEKQKEAEEKAKAKAEAEKKAAEKKKKEEAKKKAEAKAEAKKKKKPDYEYESDRAAEDVWTDAVRAGFDAAKIDVSGDAHTSNGKEDAAGVDVVYTMAYDDQEQAQKDGEKLKKMVLKHAKYGSVTVQKYKVDYKWDNYD